MHTLQTFFDKHNEKELFETLIVILERNFQDFPEVQNDYIHAMDALQNSLGNLAVKKEKDAICQQIASRILFSLAQGIQANCQYFYDPVKGNFLNTDPEIYLNEKAARKLPEYEAAQEARKQFYAGLNDTQKQSYRDVTEYICYLETVGPKLAHYYGYLLGNVMLHRLIPGYHPDIPMTLRYCTMLKNYFGVDLDLSFLLESSFPQVNRYAAGVAGIPF